MEDVDCQCAVCHQDFPIREMLCIAKEKEEIVLYNLENKRRKDAFYICRKPQCITRCRECDLVRKVFKVETSDRLYLELAKLSGRVDNYSLIYLIGFAKRSGKVIIGTEAVLSGVKKRKVKIIVVDQRISSHSLKKLESLASRWSVPLIRFEYHHPLEQIVGKPNCRCVGILHSEFVDTIIKFE